MMRSNRKRLFLGVLLLAAGTLGACISWHDEREASSSLPTSLSSPSTEADVLAPPNLPRLEERQRYLQATIEGDQRAIALIDSALERARLRTNPAPEYIEKLERVRRERMQRQARYLAERSSSR